MKRLAASLLLAGSLIALIPGSAAYAADEPTNENSIESDWCGKYTDVELGGDPNLRPLNRAILDGTQDSAVSAYDRFGNNLRFIGYYGEKKYTISLIDNLYNDAVNNKDESSIDLGTFLDISDSTVQDKVYSTRVDLISEEEYNAGSEDPRREAYTCVPGVVGGDIAVGNFFMGIANNMQTVVAWVLDLEGTIGDIANIIATVVTPLQPLLFLLLGFAVLGFIFFLTKAIFKIVRGTISFRSVVGALIAGLLSLGVFTLFIVNPTVFTNTTNVVTGAVSTLGKGTLNSTTGAPFCNSSDLQNTYSCNLFYSTVYKSWYAAEGFDTLSISDGTAAVVGTPQVPLGGGTNAESWDVLTYSALSRFHIQVFEPDEVPEGEWSAKLPLNNNFNVDLVRSFDARMGIENPPVTDPGERVNVPGHQIDSESRTPVGMWMSFKSFTLIPLAIAGAIKAWALLSILVIFVMFLKDALLTIWRPEESRITNPFVSLWDNFKVYLFATLQVLIMITMYNWMSEGPMIFLYIILSIGVLMIRPNSTKKMMEQAKGLALKARSAMIRKKTQRSS